MILFQLEFKVDPNKAEEFERTYAEVFQPALSRQEGFGSVRFVRLFAAPVAKEIEAAPTDFNYQVLFTFQSEELRRKWATSPDHDVAWPKLESLTLEAHWRGYDLLKEA